jgi:hypothetical protein
MRTHWSGRFTDCPESGEGVSCLVVSPKVMVKLDAVEFLFQLSYPLLVCSHAGVMTVRVSHVDDEFRVSTDTQPLNPKPSQTID